MTNYFLQRQATKAFGRPAPAAEKKSYIIPKQSEKKKQQVKDEGVQPRHVPAKKSAKRKIDHKEYVKIVKEMLKENIWCEIGEVGCQLEATGLHHKQKRLPSNFLDRDNLMRACNNCNTWVENNPLEAIEKGYSISKHIKPSGVAITLIDGELNTIVVEEIKTGLVAL